MRNISVMDTIHGENRGERFKKLPGMQLYKSRKMSIPFFMASCDISGRIKRYVYLIVSYSLGIVVILMLLQLKRTIVNENFSKTYWHIADRELMIRPEEGLRDKLIQQEGSYRNVFLYYERFFNENGVPLNIQIAAIQNAFMINGAEKEGIDLYFGDFEPERLTIVKGGRPPEKTNEVAVSHFLQKTKGVQIGDTITIEYMVYSDDGFSKEKKTRDFLVTAYIETYGLRSADIFTAGLKEDIVMDSWDIFNEGIDADGEEYDAAIEKMRELMPEAQIWDKDQVLAFDLGDQFGGIIDLLTIVLSIILGITFSAMTLLYEQIFIEEETADIAMMKSMGMDRATIRKWHFERIMILIAIASVIGIIMAFTVSKYALELLGISALSLVSFSIADPPLLSVVIVPAVLAILISLVLMAALKSMDDIQIWRVRNE
jgi:ABC-type antimicrobial peptide transport system permease subunit